MSDVVIFGSSHVKRLDNFIIANPFLNNFRLQKFRITFHGISGGRINNPQDIMEFEHLIQTHNPRFVFVHLGGGGDFGSKEQYMGRRRGNYPALDKHLTPLFPAIFCDDCGLSIVI
jgi:hypothetical protein